MFEHTLIFSSIVEENLLLTHLLESTYIYLYSICKNTADSPFQTYLKA